MAINRGEAEAGTAALRKAWIEEDFGPFDERGLLARQGARLRAEDHQARLDRLLWEGQADAAKRMLPLVSADYRALAEARLALAADSSNAAKLVAKLPGSAAQRPGAGLRAGRAAAQKGQERGRGRIAARDQRIDASGSVLGGAAHPVPAG